MMYGCLCSYYIWLKLMTKKQNKTQIKTFQSLHLLDFILHQTKAETITQPTIGLIGWALSPLCYTKRRHISAGCVSSTINGLFLIYALLRFVNLIHYIKQKKTSLKCWPSKTVLIHNESQSNLYGLTLTVVCPTRPDWKLLMRPEAASMALGISAGDGGTSSTRA